MHSFIVSVSELVEELHDLVEWGTFAIHLPMINKHDIGKIAAINHNTVDQKKLALFTLWLDKCEAASWDHVVTALKKLQSNTLAKKG